MNGKQVLIGIAIAVGCIIVGQLVLKTTVEVTQYNYETKDSIVGNDQGIIWVYLGIGTVIAWIFGAFKGKGS